MLRDLVFSPSLWVVLLGAVLVALWLLGAYNRLVRLRGVVAATFPALEIQLRKRQALVKHLAEAVQGAPFPAALEAPIRARGVIASYAAQQALQTIERLHKRVLLDGPMQKLQATEAALDDALDALTQALQQAAVDAPLNDPIADFLDRLQRLREPISYSVGVYDQAALDYNADLAIFPTTLAAGVFQFKPAVVLTLTSPAPSASPDAATP